MEVPACVHAVHRTKLVHSPSHKSDIGIFNVKIQSEGAHHHECPIAAQTKTLDEVICEHTTFNMLTGEIDKYTYRVPKWARRHFRSIVYIEDVLLSRRDQLLLPIRKANVGGDEDIGAGLVALSSVPTSAKVEKQTSEPESESGSELIQSWTGGSFMPATESEDPEAEYSAPISVKGDEDFVILFGKNEFVVWCFDETVVLPQYST
jgi:hypothetical protein